MERRILVFDELPIVRDLLGEILTLDGYRMVAAPVGDVDPAQLAADPPALIILDYLRHPNDCGWALAQKLKAHAATAAIPLLVCSGAVERRPALEAWLQAHGSAWLSKPFAVDDLTASINRLLAACPAEAR